LWAFGVPAPSRPQRAVRGRGLSRAARAASRRLWESKREVEPARDSSRRLRRRRSHPTRAFGSNDAGCHAHGYAWAWRQTHAHAKPWAWHPKLLTTFERHCFRTFLDLQVDFHFTSRPTGGSENSTARGKKLWPGFGRNLALGVSSEGR